MSTIMGPIELEHPELFALEFGKIAEYDFVYTLSSTNIDQSVPNLVKMYMIIRSQMSLIMDLIDLYPYDVTFVNKYQLHCIMGLNGGNHCHIVVD